MTRKIFSIFFLCFWPRNGPFKFILSTENLGYKVLNYFRGHNCDLESDFFTVKKSRNSKYLIIFIVMGKFFLCIHTHTHAYMYTYTRTHIHTETHTCVSSSYRIDFPIAAPFPCCCCCDYLSISCKTSNF